MCFVDIDSEDLDEDDFDEDALNKLVSFKGAHRLGSPVVLLLNLASCGGVQECARREDRTRRQSQSSQTTP